MMDPGDIFEAVKKEIGIEIKFEGARGGSFHNLHILDIVPGSLLVISYTDGILPDGTVPEENLIFEQKVHDTAFVIDIVGFKHQKINIRLRKSGMWPFECNVDISSGRPVKPINIVDDVYKPEKLRKK